MLVLADIMTPFSKLTVQVYSPESADSTEARLFDDVYSVKDFILGLTDGVTTVPSGPCHTIVIDSGTSTTDLVSTVHIKVGEYPAENTWLGELEWTLTIGSGTKKNASKMTYT